jgi:hypothetical protein
MDIFSVSVIIWGNVMTKCFTVKKIYSFDINLFLSKLVICIEEVPGQVERQSR